MSTFAGVLFDKDGTLFDLTAAMQLDEKESTMQEGDTDGEE